jgi:hypothetical protein
MKAWSLVGWCLALGACQRTLPELPRQLIPEPSAADVATVVFLTGDAGDALEARSPLLWRLRGDVEAWSRQLTGDSAVIVIFLGDNVYPDGLDRSDEPAFERDSAVLQGQVNTVSGPAARQHAMAFFVAGNHDWGDYEGGDERLKVQQEFLDRRRTGGVRVRLLPEAGQPGPAAVDVGRHLRILLFDTAWWLLATDKDQKTQVFRRTEDLLRGAGARHVMIAAHHPFKSASSHGGNVQFWRTVGVKFLLSRSGALLQDHNSLPYRELLDAMKESFRVKQPLVFAAGHDHALQVIRHDEANEPAYTLVSGSASKVSRIGHTRGMQYRGSAPGYMKLFFRRDGHVELFVVSAPGGEERLQCGGEGAALQQCMAEFTADFETRFGSRLR